MKKFEDMDQNTTSIMEQGKISDADLDQVTGGVFDEREHKYTLDNLLFRKKNRKDLRVVTLPMRSEQDDDRDQQQGGSRVIKL